VRLGNVCIAMLSAIPRRGLPKLLPKLRRQSQHAQGLGGRCRSQILSMFSLSWRALSIDEFAASGPFDDVPVKLSDHNKRYLSTGTPLVSLWSLVAVLHGHTDMPVCTLS
jgi:hypothetical protein